MDHQGPNRFIHFNGLQQSAALNKSPSMFDDKRFIQTCIIDNKDEIKFSQELFYQLKRGVIDNPQKKYLYQSLAYKIDQQYLSRGRRPVSISLVDQEIELFRQTYRKIKSQSKYKDICNHCVKKPSEIVQKNSSKKEQIEKIIIKGGVGAAANQANQAKSNGKACYSYHSQHVWSYSGVQVESMSQQKSNQSKAK